MATDNPESGAEATPKPAPKRAPRKAAASAAAAAPAKRAAAPRRVAAASIGVEAEPGATAPEPAPAPSVAAPAFDAAAPSSRGGAVRGADVTAFLRQLIMLLEAGTPILRALRALSERGERAATRALVQDIALFVESGNPLWQAFDRHPRYFDTVFVNLIKASEASGNLVPVLRRVTDYRIERELYAKRVRGAMWYPGLLVAACFGVLYLLASFVVPEFEAMFKKANLEIPPITQQFLLWSAIFSKFFYVPILAVFAAIALYRVWFVRSPIRRLWADRVKLSVPVLGPIVHKNAIVEFTQTLTILLRSGLSMMAALDLTRNAIHNRAVAQTLQAMRDSVEQGGSLEPPMRASAGVIPPVVADMIVTGEESGRVDEVCAQITKVYEEEVKIAVGTLGESLQPIFTVFIGVVVMFLFIALFLPLVSMIQSLAGSGA